jgi:hypothetical protein
MQEYMNWDIAGLPVVWIFSIYPKREFIPSDGDITTIRESYVESRYLHGEQEIAPKITH